MFNRCNNLLDLKEYGFDVDRGRVKEYKNTNHERVGGCIDYLVGSRYAVVTYYYISLDNDYIYNLSCSLGLLLYDLGHEFKYKNHKRGKRLSYPLKNSLTFVEGCLSYATKDYTCDLNTQTLKMFLSKRECLNPSELTINATYYNGIEKQYPDKISTEKERLTNFLLYGFCKSEYSYKGYYAELTDIIETYLIKGRVYFKNMNKFLSKSACLIYEYVNFLPLESEYNIELKDCRIYSNAGGLNQVSAEKRILQRIDNNDNYEISYYVNDIAYFHAWVCNKINGRSIKKIEQKMTEVRKRDEAYLKLEGFLLNTTSFDVLYDLCRVIQIKYGFDLYPVFSVVDLKINIEVYRWNLIEEVAITYDAVNRGRKRGYLFNIDKDNLDKTLMQYAKNKLMGRQVKTVCIDMDKDWNLRDLRLICA